MKVKLIVLWALILGLAAHASAQMVSGEVYELNDEGQKIPLVGANVYWLGTSRGVPSDDAGKFSIERTDRADRLVVSYIGYRNDLSLIHIYCSGKSCSPKKKKLDFLKMIRCDTRKYV